jgi:hypothetical protein
MTTKQSFYNSKNSELKTKIIKDRLSHLFHENSKSLAKIIVHLLKKDKERKKNV